MKKALRIKNKELAEILNEGTQLIQSNVITGFNFDNTTTQPQLALLVQYYHNVETHLTRFLEKAQEAFASAFGLPLSYECAKKWGLFKWREDFDDEPGNKYYAVSPLSTDPTHGFSFERVKYQELPKAGGKLVLAKDRSYLVTLNPADGMQARFLIDFIKAHCVKYIMPGEENPGRIDDYTHVKPLFILKDEGNEVADKSDLELVYRLGLSKGNRVISSLIREGDLGKVLEKLKSLSCGHSAKQEKRYVGREFFQDY